MSDWMLCPAAKAEAERTGLVYRCDGRRNHVCDGERTAHLWDARGPHGEPFKSEHPCCGSCVSDEEYGPSRGLDDDCCCVHRQEWESQHREAVSPMGDKQPVSREVLVSLLVRARDMIDKSYNGPEADLPRTVDGMLADIDAALNNESGGSSAAGD